MNLKEIGLEDIGWIQLGHDWFQWQAVVNAV
jgi:hypothetical protein